MSIDVLQKPTKPDKLLSPPEVEALIEPHIRETDAVSNEEVKKMLENPGNANQDDWNNFANGNSDGKGINEVLPELPEATPTQENLGETALQSTVKLDQAS